MFKIFNSEIVEIHLISTKIKIVDLKIKRYVQFAFDFDKITNNESIFIDKQKIFIRNDVFYFEIRQKNAIEKNVNQIFRRSRRFDVKIQRHFRQTTNH